LSNHFGKARQVQPAVQSCEEAHAEPAEQRQMQPVNVSMDHVELLGATGHGLQQCRLRGHWIAAWTAKPKRARPDSVKPGARARVAAREQRHLMSELDEFVDKPGNDTFGAAIEIGRHTFGQWSNLSDPHPIPIRNNCRTSRANPPEGRLIRNFSRTVSRACEPSTSRRREFFSTWTMRAAASVAFIINVNGVRFFVTPPP